MSDGAQPRWAVRAAAVSEWSFSPTPLLPAILRERLAVKMVADRVAFDGENVCLFARDLGADFWGRKGLNRRASEALLVQVKRFVKRHATHIAPWPAFDRLPASDLALESLPIAVRTLNAVRYEGWECVADLKNVTFHDLQRTPNIGTRSLLELTCCVEAALAEPVIARPQMSADQMAEAVMANFSEREWRVLELRVLCCTPLSTMAALGREIGVSGNRTRQIEAAVRRKLATLLRQESGAALCRFSLDLRRTLGDAVSETDLASQLARCPGIHRLTGIWRARLQQLVLWMAGPYVLREGLWVQYPAPPRTAHSTSVF